MSIKTKFKQDSERPTTLCVTPVEQDTMTYNYKKLTSVPEPLSNKILHLHLAHNNITSLMNIHLFPMLKSLNVSYNKLTDINDFKAIVNKEKLIRLSVRENKFEQYGYEDKLVSMFENLKQLDHIKLSNRFEADKQKQFIKQNLMKSSYIVNRLLEMMQSFNSQININNQIGINQQDNQQNKIHKSGLLKLLYENISQKSVYELTDLIVKAKDIENASTQNHLKTIVKIITIFLSSDVKCTCRPFNLRQSLFKSYKQSFEQLLFLFSLRFDQKLEKYLSKNIVNTNKMQASNKKKQEMMKQFQKFEHQTPKIMSSLNPGEYIQKVNALTLKTSLIEVLRPKKGLTTKPQQYHLNQMKQEVQNNILSEQTNQYLFRFPFFVYSSNYAMIITIMLIKKVENILLIHNRIVGYQTTKRIKIQKTSKNKNIKQIGYNNLKALNNKENMSTKAKTTLYNQNIDYGNQISFDKTLPDSTKEDQMKFTVKQQKKRKLSGYLNSQRLSILPQQVTAQYLYNISLKYKVFRAFIVNISLSRQQK